MRVVKLCVLSAGICSACIFVIFKKVMTAVGTIDKG
jgi:hypothetical protein